MTFQIINRDEQINVVKGQNQNHLVHVLFTALGYMSSITECEIHCEGAKGKMYRKLKNVNKIDNGFLTFELVKIVITFFLKSCGEHLIYPLVHDKIVLCIG